MSSLINTNVKPFNNKAYHAKDQYGEFIDITEESLKGHWSVFVFYPADFTFVCPTELSDLADHYEELKKLNVEVYAISTDTHFSHKAWHDSSESIKKIKFPMLADPTGALARNFDVMIEEEGLALRGTFIINSEGKIKTIEVNDLGIGRSAADLVRKVQAAQHIEANPNEVCPASWKPGAETLKPSLDLVGKI
ncbi:alkyl hydroperoxide reductase subunit C [Methylophilaceae bacterium]|jgi:NADH-dependent peroxiredoxin subunit C|nr:alkyl hydroperoxide reductase subunit C [Methylophilaceae bacterium]|tara:strand:- start:670 stop:1248 length:579 start_codon:yes stop_codon:yes gene_type:complete